MACSVKPEQAISNLGGTQVIRPGY